MKIKHIHVIGAILNQLRYHREKHLKSGTPEITMAASYQKRHVRKRRKHEGVRHYCNKCDYAAITSSHHSEHLKKKHGEYRYNCNKCEYVATTVGGLKIHKEIKHELLRYPCGKCEYAGTAIHNLRMHIERKHEGVR